MFYVSVFLKTVEDWNAPDVSNNLKMLSDSTVMLHELTKLLRYKLDKIDFIDKPVEVGFDCPLDLHCTYTRDQILVALDFMKPSSLREGVKWLPEKQLDIFFITLNKSDKDYSPTTIAPIRSAIDVHYYHQMWDRKNIQYIKQPKRKKRR